MVTIFISEALKGNNLLIFFINFVHKEYANRGEKPPAPIKFAPVEEEEIKGDKKLLQTKSLKSKQRKKGRSNKNARRKNR